ncbi:MAG TPA: ATP-binding cassette domain-containing protein [Thermoanaerobaculia bacterium]|nr:ATP-binding cassette domain-containing protein [Thermoanaerobaculia bacterium]
MIDVQHFTMKYYGPPAVDDISFSIPEGAIVGFLGPNGAGKTSTMRVLTGYLPPTEGEVRIAGHDVVREPIAARAAIGYLPENVALYPEMRVREYLAYRADLEGVRRADRSARVADVMERCLIADVAEKTAGTLSKGYRQRVALAGALVHRPPILILDEPTVGLDPKQIIKIRELIKELGRERTVLLSTHILPEVEAVCDQVLIIDRGKIVAQGTPEELRRRGSGASIVRATFAGDVPARDALAAIDGVRGIEETRTAGETRVRIEAAEGVDVREAVFHRAVENRWTMRELAGETATLEDVFVRLTTRDHAEAAAGVAAANAAETGA